MKRRAKKGEPQEWLRAHVAHKGSACLLWPFAKARGFGNLEWDGAITYAHKIMCELVNGPPPSPNHKAAHSCGTDACVHPDHVSWRPLSEIRAKKTSYRRGRSSLLTEAAVRAIRKAADKKTHDELARQYNISRRQVGKIIDRTSWPDVL